MIRQLRPWLLALAAIALAAFCLTAAFGLLPSQAAAQKRSMEGPLLLTWIMIGLTTASAVTLVAFLIAVGLGHVRHTRP